MRVLLVSAYFRPHVGGIESFAELLARGLAARGHELTVLCCRTDPAAPPHEESDGYRIVRLPATNALERLFRVPYPVPSPAALARTPGQG